MEPAPPSEDSLEERLSRPTEGVLDSLRRVPGDILVLGAGGKMGPSLARMARRAIETLGTEARVVAVSRFGTPGTSEWLQAAGVETIPADLLDRTALSLLPDAPNLIFMAGQKFGTAGSPSRTWALNALVPALVAERFPAARTVVFSTGNVYPLTAAASGGPSEDHALGPVGEYAMSCVARERIFEHASITHGTPVAIVRLNYANELRYGVLVDLARRVRAGEPIDLSMGYVNVIWQGDANARALQCLTIAASPPTVLNVTGTETLSVRQLATRFGERLGRAPVFQGAEASDALLSDARRSVELFGPPAVSTDQLMAWTVGWLEGGGRLLDKPTRFEARDGRF
jgi:nucleoside-diphosphate-sugar epimerase